MKRIPESGIEPNGSDDRHELVLERSPGAEIYQGGSWNKELMDKDIIEMNELYTPVKDKDGRTRWVFCYRGGYDRGEALS